MSEISIIEIDAFIRSIGVNCSSPHTLFLGAGASISSGVPSAETCIWQWKKSIYCTNNPGREDQVVETSLSSVQQRIDHWLRSNGIQPADGQDDYSFYIEKCLPIADDRRRYFADWIRKARPYSGYKLLCLLAEHGLFNSVWTTNFDGLVARAAGEFDITPIEVGIESRERTFRQPNRNELVCVSLHGDYRYDTLKNTEEELQRQEADLIEALVSTLKTSTLVVAGYSGRDPSVMKALQKAVLQDNFSGKIFWCGYSEEPPDVAVELLLAAATNDIEAYFVPGVAFDDAMARLALHCLEGNQRETAIQVLGSLEKKKALKRSPFSVPKGDPTTVIKSNAWPIRCPAEMFKFELKKWPEEQVWRWLEEKTDGFQVVAVPFRKVLAFGTLDAIRDAFQDEIEGTIQRVPITERDTRIEDGAVLHLLLRALTRSIAAGKGFYSDRRRMLWENRPYRNETRGSDVYEIHRAARLALRRIGNDMYLTMDPTVIIPSRADGDEDVVRSMRTGILGYQHNKEFNKDLNRWRRAILKRNIPTEYDFPPESGAFVFRINSAPAFAAIKQASRKSVQFSDGFKHIIRHRGIMVPEPTLQFSKLGDRRQTDCFPVRGLAMNGPFDRRDSPSDVERPIRVGVICPRAESRFVADYLAESAQKHSPARGNKEEYLVPFDGFEPVFRTPIEIPCVGDQLWHELPEFDQQLSERDGALDLSRKVVDGVEALASAGRSIIIVFTPNRWRRWRGFQNDHEAFDLHDFVKAHCVQRGIATQFLDQDTLDYSDKCRVWWWLSIAIYAKAMRTPWVLNGLDSDTAFVGIGYSTDRAASKGRHIVLGCGHIYNSQGQGLQFRLSRIENPIFSGGNPYLCFEDARRLGETIRTLFWESHLRLPRRVVIHKQTPFRQDEQKGLMAGLEGVGFLELVEINFESAIRYLSSQPKKDGGFIEGRFPVRRGTAVKLDDHEALLWVHGSTDATKPNWTYFQGKRRIPGPVLLRRYAGTSDLATLASEILGLSKMDWNSGDLYAKLPATIQSSRRIARIGSLLDRFANTSFDYRLFM